MPAWPATIALGARKKWRRARRLARLAAASLAGRADRARAKSMQLLLLHVADELADYRAFTRVLRDQGQRITELTADAACVIGYGLTGIDAGLEQLAQKLENQGAMIADPNEIAAQIRGLGAPIATMLGKLQFQDVTQQQITFLSRLSLILDEHMIELARRLGERRAGERAAHFKEMFDLALDDCVMDSQRDDHHAATGLALRETGAPSVELF